ncbi:TetR/AcrR family transcriptional regulator [Nocardia abscessus]|uniref:TetR/AcrR family transcriptional regulator n=1 Tax=Nocardia abscessus TaxID=120957 RepID=UPI002453757C|nr:helix-turn-helix domain-containing protein [Nocardia abscessus]
MSETDDRLESVLDAAYACFVRHGFKRTTMDDIARQVGLARPTLYLTVRNKDEAFRLVAQRLLDRAAADATTAAKQPGELPARVFGVLEPKLALAITLHRDSPAHAPEFLTSGSRQLGSMVTDYVTTLADLVTDILAEQVPRPDAEQAAAILVSLTYGLESDLTDPDTVLEHLRRAVSLIIDGLQAPQHR